MARPTSNEAASRHRLAGEEIFPGFTHYRRWAKHRQIPVLRLEPFRDHHIAMGTKRGA